MPKKETMYTRYCDYMESMPEIFRHTPQPSLRERDRRWQRVREEMKYWDLDCLLVWGSDAQFSLCEVNFRYLTAIPSQGRSLVVFPRKGEPVAFVGTAHDTFESIAYHWVSDVRTIPNTGDVVELVKELGFERSRIGYVGNIPNYWQFIQQYPIFTDVQVQLPNAVFVDAAVLLWNVELIKSLEELELLREAGKIAEKVYEALLYSARPGVREREVYADMLRALVANGGEPNSMMLMDSGNPVFAHPRHPPMSDRTLKQGDLIVVEYHVKYAGMVTHTERTVSLGTPNNETLDLFSVCQEAYQVSLDVMKPGVSLKDAVDALRTPIRRAGCSYLECGYHAHGCTSGGFPGFNDPDENLDDISNVYIKENMVFTQEVDLFDPKYRRGNGVVMADSFVVKETEAEVFARIPAELAIIS